MNFSPPFALMFTRAAMAAHGGSDVRNPIITAGRDAMKHGDADSIENPAGPLSGPGRPGAARVDCHAGDRP